MSGQRPPQGTPWQEPGSRGQGGSLLDDWQQASLPLLPRAAPGLPVISKDPRSGPHICVLGVSVKEPSPQAPQQFYETAGRRCLGTGFLDTRHPSRGSQRERESSVGSGSCGLPSESLRFVEVCALPPWAPLCCFLLGELPASCSGGGREFSRRITPRWLDLLMEIVRNSFLYLCTNS